MRGSMRGRHGRYMRDSMVEHLWVVDDISIAEVPYSGEVVPLILRHAIDGEDPSHGPYSV